MDDMLPSSIVRFSSCLPRFSQDNSSYWSTVVVFFVITLILMVFMIYRRFHQIDDRYPWDSGNLSPDPGLFMSKSLMLILMLLKTVFGFLFWLHFLMVVYWVFWFKTVEEPTTLLPGSLSSGNDYVHHDSRDSILRYLEFVVVRISSREEDHHPSFEKKKLILIGVSSLREEF